MNLSAGSRPRPNNILLLAFGFPVQYRALRGAAASGANVFVLGDAKASILRHSRYCRNFWLLTGNYGDSACDLNVLIQEIDKYATIHKLEMVLAGDAKATRLLSQIRTRLSIPTFPIPSTDTFDILDDKWAFYQLCRRLSIPTPQSWLFKTKADLLHAAKARHLPARLIAKPLRLFGEIGIVTFDAENAAERVESIDYQPILVQEYVDGLDLDLSIFVYGGNTVAAIWHYKKGQTYVLPRNDLYLSYGCRIAEHLRTDGLLNFDSRVTEDGRVYLLECNPRTYLSMDYALITGINFIDIGLRDWQGYDGAPLIREGRVKTLNGTFKSLITPWRIERSDLRMAAHALADPVPQVLDNVRLVLQKCPTVMRQQLRRIQFLEPLLE